MTYFARSATSASMSPQTYFEHASNVSEHACRYMEEALRYWRGQSDAGTLSGIICLAAAFHDLGKLDDGNQFILAGSNPRASLPIPHQDAGVAHLLRQNEDFSALLVYAHHIGLPDMSDLQLQQRPMRINNAEKRQQVDATLTELLARHEQTRAPKFLQCPTLLHPLLATDFRLIFSCLADADHGDAARASGEITKTITYPALRPEERLKALSAYVAQQAEKNKSDIPAEQQRNIIRDSFFNACLKSEVGQSLTLCDAPVGTGKTTSVMAHLLRVAYAQKLRRIFVILPFTNIIRQSADTYRKALVLPGEDPDSVVAEIHHRADFKDRESRQLTALWNAPIIVTTAVAFFETLASNWPASVRRLHNLPGSAVFLDEAHAMLPVKLLPLAWHWIKHSAQNWCCHWTLASGSLNRFWELDEFRQIAPSLPDPANIISDTEQSEMSVAEISRVTYRYKPGAMELNSFVNWLASLDGPILVVLNTVHTAAAAAKKAEQVFGEGNVFHLSTSLAPQDRETTLDLVKARLRCKGHTKWCLLATSCIEAGVDISFRTGVRECASLSSLLQLSGRVNRGAEFNDSDVWTITLLKTDEHVVENPAWTVSARILQRFFTDGIDIAPDLCTEALTKELREHGICESLKALQKAEDTCAFETVEQKFRVIESDAVPVVVNKNLIERIENFKEVSWRDIQRGSVQIRKNLCEKMAVQEARRYPGLFLWKGEYSSFLGYMEGILRCADIDKAGGAII